MRQRIMQIGIPVLLLLLLLLEAVSPRLCPFLVFLKPLLLAAFLFSVFCFLWSLTVLNPGGRGDVVGIELGTFWDVTNILGEEEGSFWGKLGNFLRVVGNRWSSGNGKAKDDDTRIATRFILISISG